jgi:hypothetical protein
LTPEAQKPKEGGMTLNEFRAALSAAAPPQDVSPLLRALWLDAHGDWAGAHAIAQDVDTAFGAWVHAYLHRKEGDEGNAAYWYRRARRAICAAPLEDEWQEIARALCEGD